ncbi:MAG: ScyD/ScyE family protein [Acidobacteria bacterium]|nr:ScyD/ScyE family protein [Acidobacteriota bacterium]
MNRKFIQFCLLLAALTLAQASLFGQDGPATVAAGLESPYKMTMTPAGNLLVGETGKGSNAGRITLVNKTTGAKSILVSGLPSVSSDESNESITGMIVRERTLYALTGEGDVVISGTAPGTQIPNPKVASSPIFSALLAFRFPSELEAVTAPFVMTAQDQLRLANGIDVELDNGAGAKVTVQMVANFQDVTPDANTIGRASHPFGMDFAKGNSNFLYIADSGQNKLLRVDVTTGRTRTMATFPPIPNQGGFGPPVSDVVPTNVRAYGDQLLMTYLSGFPFTPGASGAYLVNPATGEWQPFLTNHTSVMDVLVRESDDNPRPQFWVLEFSANMLAQPGLPGRLVTYATQTPTVAQGGLVTPVSMVRDSNGDIYVSELATGRIVKVAAK